MTACAAKKVDIQANAPVASLRPAPLSVKNIPLIDPEQVWKIAIDAFKSGSWDTVLLMCSQIADQYPNTIWYKRSLFLKERAFIQLDRPADAASAMLSVRAEYPEIADYAVFLLAEYSFFKEQYSEAAALYGVLMENYPKSSLQVRSEYRRGLSFLDMYAYPQAIDAFTRFLEKCPRSEFCSDAGIGLGRALTAETQLSQAILAYQDVWIRNPGTSADQDVEISLAELKAGGVDVPDFTSQDFYERGKNLFRQNQFDKTAEVFTKLLEKEPSFLYRADVLFRTGIALFYMNRRIESAAVLENMVRDFPTDSRIPEALYWLGKSYSKLGDGERGVKSFQKIIDRFPESEWVDDALFLTGNIYREAGNMQKAIVYYSRLVREYSDSKFADSAMWWIAWSYYTAGDYQRSQRTLEDLVNRYPRSFLVNQARYWQGRVAEKKGNSSLAIAYYEKVLKKGPYTYYGYRGEERKRILEETGKVVKADDPADITAACDTTPCSNDLMSSFDTDDGPPVWTEETKRILSADATFKKTLELMSLDMKNEAAQELWALQGKIPQQRGILIGLSKAFFELGDYYRSLQLVLRHYERYLERPTDGTPEDIWLLAYPQGYWETIQSYARKYDQDPFFIAAIIREESQFSSDALSQAGARGLMQVMPATGEWVAKRIKLNGFDNGKLFDPDMGINIGTWYISFLMKKFKGDPLLAAAAYNAGPDAVTAWLGKYGYSGERDAFVEAIPFPETRGYVKKVLRNYGEYKRIYGKTSGEEDFWSLNAKYTR